MNNPNCPYCSNLMIQQQDCDYCPECDLNMEGYNPPKPQLAISPIFAPQQDFDSWQLMLKNNLIDQILALSGGQAGTLGLIEQVMTVHERVKAKNHA